MHLLSYQFISNDKTKQWLQIKQSAATKAAHFPSHHNGILIEAINDQ